MGASACQKTTFNGSAGSDAGGPYGVVTSQADSGRPQAPAPSGGDSGHAQPVSELAPSPPPPLPTYDQPPPPEDGDIWTPGYWAWNTSDEGYYWAPGTWVEPPRPGLYWTPGYWRYLANGYGFVPGYWGPTVGFYGGVNYGWGYGGNGYEGGRWRNNHFYYNQAANNLGDRHFAGVYREPVHVVNSGHASFNGGPRGVDVRVPLPQRGGERLAPTQAQREHVRMAAAQSGLRASVNHGAPVIVATTRPGQLRGPGVVTVVRSAPHYDPPARVEVPAAARNPARQQAARPPQPRGDEPRTKAVPPARPATPPPREERPAPEARPAPEYHAAPQAQHVAPPMVHEAPHAPPRPVEAPHPVAAAPRPAPPPPHAAAPAPHPADPDKPHR